MGVTTELRRPPAQWEAHYGLRPLSMDTALSSVEAEVSGETISHIQGILQFDVYKHIAP